MNARLKQMTVCDTVEERPERESIRYRLATLLTVEEFETALCEAKLALDADKILMEDYRFVIEIVRAAERMGRVRTHAIELLNALAA